MEVLHQSVPSSVPRCQGHRVFCDFMARQLMLECLTCAVNKSCDGLRCDHQSPWYLGQLHLYIRNVTGKSAANLRLQILQRFQFSAQQKRLFSLQNEFNQHTFVTCFFVMCLITKLLPHFCSILDMAENWVLTTKPYWTRSNCISAQQISQYILHFHSVPGGTIVFIPHRKMKMYVF